MWAALRAEGNKGQAIIVIALMLPALLGMLGLVVDGSMLLSERRGAQNASDAATLAATYDLLDGNGSGSAIASAMYYAAQNGYNNDGTTNTVTVSIPPTSGPHAGDGNFAQVRITRNLRTFLIQIVSGGTSAASASAVGGVVRTPSPYSIITLNEMECESLEVGGSAGLVVDGGIMVNSDCASNALDVGGSADLSASRIDVVGGYEENQPDSISPEPTTGSPPISDPLADLSAPNPSGLSVRHGTADEPEIWKISSGGPYTLQPGIYYGGLVISGSVEVTFNPGIYYIAGGGFQVIGTGDVTGNGIFIYNTNDPDHTSGDGDYGEVKLTGSGTIQLSAPTSGTYQGLLFFQDRNNNEAFEINGSGDMNSTGTIYVPNALVEIGGNGSLGATQIIADRVAVDGSGTLEVPYDRSLYYAVPSAALVQ